MYNVCIDIMMYVCFLFPDSPTHSTTNPNNGNKNNDHAAQGAHPQTLVQTRYPHLPFSQVNKIPLLPFPIPRSFPPLPLLYPLPRPNTSPLFHPHLPLTKVIQIRYPYSHPSFNIFYPRHKHHHHLLSLTLSPSLLTPSHTTHPRTRTCHSSRRLCKGESSVREETYATEEQAISAVSALSSDLRRSLDKVCAPCQYTPSRVNTHLLILTNTPFSMCTLLRPTTIIG